MNRYSLNSRQEPVVALNDKSMIVNFEDSPFLIKGGQFRRFLLFLLILLLLSLILSLYIGSVSIPPFQVIKILINHILGFYSNFEVDKNFDKIVWDFRLPRTLLGIITGSSLAVAGVVMQALLRNPLADPYILGSVSGASVGAVAIIVTEIISVTSITITFGAFIGSLCALFLVFIFGQRGGIFTPGRLILAGVAVNYLMSSITSYLQICSNPNELRSILFWLLGSFAGCEYHDLTISFFVFIFITLILILQSRYLNALLLGEESAYVLGLNVNRYRIFLLISASLLTSSVVSVSGGIGFVGLMIPHIVRILVGSDHRRVMIVSALLGGIFLLWVDILARVVIRPAEMPIGIITGAIGAPFFLYIMYQKGRSRWRL